MEEGFCRSCGASYIREGRFLTCEHFSHCEMFKVRKTIEPPALDEEALKMAIDRGIAFALNDFELRCVLRAVLAELKRQGVGR